MPEVGAYARITVRLPAATFRRLESLAERLPGISPNRLTRLAVERLLDAAPQSGDILRALLTTDDRRGDHG